MELIKAIQGLYPELKMENGDFTVRNRDDGSAYIESWNNSRPMPTQEDLKRGWFLYRKKAKKSQGRNRMIEKLVSEVVEDQSQLSEPAAHAIVELLVKVILNTQNPDGRTKLRNRVNALDSLSAQVEAVQPTDPQNPDWLALAQQVDNIPVEVQ